MAHTRQHVPPEVRADDPLKHKIMDAGYFPCRIVRRFAPHDTGDTAEVLFLGHERTYRNRGETRPLTAWLPDDDGTVVVTESWG